MEVYIVPVCRHKAIFISVEVNCKDGMVISEALNFIRNKISHSKKAG
jgi:hypothetical protein